MNKDITAVQSEIVDAFLEHDDWLDRYALLVSLGRAMSPFPEVERNEKNAISGCQSNVWIKMEIIDGEIVLAGDSDAAITKGILAILIDILNHRPVEEVMECDLFFIRDIGLSSNLSPARGDGLRTIIRSIKDFARGNYEK